MLSDEWLSRYGLLENFNASVTRTGTGTGTHTGTGTWTTGVTAIALCTSCSRAKNENFSGFFFIFSYFCPKHRLWIHVISYFFNTMDRQPFRTCNYIK